MLIETKDEKLDISYKAMADMARIPGFGDLSIPQNCECRRSRNNVPVSLANVHFKQSILTPFFEYMPYEFNLRFAN